MTCLFLELTKYHFSEKIQIEYQKCWGSWPETHTEQSVLCTAVIVKVYVLDPEKRSRLIMQ